MNIYSFPNEEFTLTPALVYNLDVIKENIEKAVAVAGSADRLWPHVKSHKMSEMVHLQLSKGIKKFKCATIAEAEMTAMCGAEKIILAYPLVGPNIGRFIELQKSYSNCIFYAIGDDYTQLCALGEASLEAGITTKALIDVNLGMNRTGCPLRKLHDLSVKVSAVNGLKLEGYHCYDGHLAIINGGERQNAVDEILKEFHKIRSAVIEDIKSGLPILVMGGTPTFPCHAKHDGVFLSPGTLFINDGGYYGKFKDLDFTPGATLISRVISHPEDGMFTIDLGYKGIAADPAGERGYIVGCPEAVSAGQSEEHWMFKTTGKVPEIGTVLHVIPTHICPTSALYSEAIVTQNQKCISKWAVSARNRKLNI